MTTSVHQRIALSAVVGLSFLAVGITGIAVAAAHPQLVHQSGRPTHQYLRNATRVELNNTRYSNIVFSRNASGSYNMTWDVPATAGGNVDPDRPESLTIDYYATFKAIRGTNYDTIDVTRFSGGELWPNRAITTAQRGPGNPVCPDAGKLVVTSRTVSWDNIPSSCFIHVRVALSDWGVQAATNDLRHSAEFDSYTRTGPTVTIR